MPVGESSRSRAATRLQSLRRQRWRRPGRSSPAAAVGSTRLGPRESAVGLGSGIFGFESSRPPSAPSALGALRCRAATSPSRPQSRARRSPGGRTCSPRSYRASGGRGGVKDSGPVFRRRRRLWARPRLWIELDVPPNFSPRRTERPAREAADSQRVPRRSSLTACRGRS